MQRVLGKKQQRWLLCHHAHGVSDGFLSGVFPPLLLHPRHFLRDIICLFFLLIACPNLSKGWPLTFLTHNPTPNPPNLAWTPTSGVPTAWGFCPSREWSQNPRGKPFFFLGIPVAASPRPGVRQVAASLRASGSGTGTPTASASGGGFWGLPPVSALPWHLCHLRFGSQRVFECSLSRGSMIGCVKNNHSIQWIKTGWGWVGFWWVVLFFLHEFGWKCNLEGV